MYADCLWRSPGVDSEVAKNLSLDRPARLGVHTWIDIVPSIKKKSHAVTHAINQFTSPAHRTSTEPIVSPKTNT